MIFSLNWLRQYFDEPLPDLKKITDGIIFHAFEVEGVEKTEKDTLLEIKVLPDRAHDCLSHFGIAREVSAILNIPMKNYSRDYEIGKGMHNKEFGKPQIKIEDTGLCRRYIGRLASNVKVGSSPAWLAERLASIGQRSINNVVDAANYVMFDIGQPMHAFDADKVKGGITARLAKAGEKIVTIDNQDIMLNKSILVIADDEGPLAIAGIKGGKRAEVTAETKNLILESANFKPVSVRRASGQIDIRTDASKRFENDLSPEVADTAMDLLSSLLNQIAADDDTVFGSKIDVYPKILTDRLVVIDIKKVNQIIGVSIPNSTIVDILNRLGIKVTENGDELSLKIPARRVDLENEENIVEEIGRIYGYDKIPAKLLNNDFTKTGQKAADKRYEVANKVREILAGLGFIEVYGYSFAHRGDIAVANPLAQDKSYLRTNLSEGIALRLSFNLQHVILDNEQVKLFEIGRVFKQTAQNPWEETMLGFGVAGKTKKSNCEEILLQAGEALEKGLNIRSLGNFNLKKQILENVKGSVCELSFDMLADESEAYKLPDLTEYISEPKQYKKISSYPRIVRDIAVWVPEGEGVERVANIIKKPAGGLLVEGPVLFDEFKKDGRKSLAYRLVFQSYEKTLSDTEANVQMDKVIEALEKEGYEVRK